ncbi:MAG TPA: hypothetical protein VMT52_02110, partial [Planctomycetota bacterium]|nr:hypothetical protein [Planctomycetota bacterium]
MPFLRLWALLGCSFVLVPPALASEDSLEVVGGTLLRSDFTEMDGDGELLESPLDPIQGASLVFSEAMVLTAEVGRAMSEPPSGCTLLPAADGTWAWRDEKTLVFRGAKPLPLATEHRLTIDGMASIAGRRLAAPFHLDLSTSRPEVDSVTPPGGSRIEL